MRRVLIVGAGIAGLSLARFLPKREFEIDLVEKGTGQPPNGFGIILWPTTLQLFQAGGIADKILAQGRIVRGTTTRSHRGRVLKDVSYASIEKDYGPYLIIEREALYEILHQDLDHIGVRYDTCVSQIDHHQDSNEVIFSDGRRKSYDLIIGADGIFSSIRPFVDPQAKLAHSGYSFWLYRIPACEDLGDKFDVHLGENAWSILASAPVGVIAILVTRTPPADQDSEAYLRRESGSFTGNHQSAVQQLPRKENSIFHWRALSVRCQQWHHNRTVLIGDAANAHPPSLSSGANLAIEDAYHLAQTMTKQGVEPAAMDRFVSQRKKRRERIAKSSRRILQFYGLKPPLSWVRDYIITLSNGVSFNRKILKDADPT